MNKETSRVQIRIGGISDPIRKQLKDQGIIVPTSDVSHFQRAVDGFIQLKILGCMGDQEAIRISERLSSKIIRWAEIKRRQQVENKTP